MVYQLLRNISQSIKIYPEETTKFALEPSEFNEMSKNILFTKNALIEHGNDFQDIELDTINNYRGDGNQEIMNKLEKQDGFNA